jgi:hypothetical protein
MPFFIAAAFFGGAFGVFVMSNLSDQRSANQIFPFLLFPQFFLAGVFNPIKHLPFPLLIASRISPMTYAVDLLRSVYYYGSPEYANAVLFSPALNLTALAGPVSNLILAFVAFILLAFFFPAALSGSVDSLVHPVSGGMAWQKFLVEILANSLFLNLGLMAFNLLPIAPLDGSKIIAPFIPAGFDEMYERFLRQGPFILLFLLVAERAFNFPFLIYWIEGIMSGVLSVMGMLIGL